MKTKADGFHVPGMDIQDYLVYEALLSVEVINRTLELFLGAATHCGLLPKY